MLDDMTYRVWYPENFSSGVRVIKATFNLELSVFFICQLDYLNLKIVLDVDIHNLIH